MSNVGGSRKKMGMNLKKLEPEQETTKDIKELDIIKISSPNTLEDLYAFEEKIYDAGDRSKVFLAHCRKTNRDVVIKMRRKGFFSGGERVWRQVLTRIMNIEQNENILGVDTILEDDSAYYVVMQKCHGGELFDFLLHETDYTDKEIGRAFRKAAKIDHPDKKNEEDGEAFIR